MSRTAFFLRAYNDIDHIAPVIWKFIKKKQNPLIVFTTNIDYKNDYRIQFLISEGPVEIIEDLDKDYINSQIINNSFIGKFSRKFYFLKRDRSSLLYKFFYKNSFDCSKELKFIKDNNISQCVFEWATPYIRGEKIEKYFIASKGIGVTTFCLPHGCNMFTHSDVNEGYRKSIQNGIIPNQAARDEYDYYIFQNPYRRDGFTKWGLSPYKTFAWGSARWCPEWQKINLSICPDFIPKKNSHDRMKLVFMQYQSNYNIDKNKIWSLLSRIAKNSNFQLVIKDSTRHGTNYSSRQFIKNFANNDNIEFVGNEANSPKLIEWSDCTIAFGSSIGIEVLCQNKNLINPHYLISNKTHFEKFNAALNANSENEVMNYLKKMINNEVIKVKDSNKKKLFSEFIYGGKEKHDVLENYYNKITNQYLGY